MKKQLIILFLILSAISTGHGSFASEKSRYGGTLRLSTISDPKSFNPVIAQETSTTMITGFIFEGLLDQDADTQEMKPNLAESWSKSEDGLIWEFKLKKDIVWNDGHPLTADDIVFSYNDLVYNEKIPCSARDILTIKGKKIKVEKIDDHSVRFTLPFPFAPFLRSAGMVEILPRHVYGKYVSNNTFALTMSLDSKPGDIIGTGPFMLNEYKPGQSIILKRNPHYWKKTKKGPLPYLEKISFSIYSDEVALIQFQQGNIDIYGVRGQDYPILKPLEKKNNFTIYNLGPSTGSNFITFNLNNNKKDDGSYYIEKKKQNLFRKKKFRKAIAHAIDKEFIIDSVFNSFAQIQYSPVSPANKVFFNTEVEKKFPYEYDPDKSKKLLEECGLKDKNKDGLLNYPDGTTVEFNLFTNSGNKLREKICEIIRKDLETVGLKVNYRLLEFNYLVEKTLNTYDWNAIVLGFTGGIEPHFGANVWRSSGHLHMWHPKQKKADFPFEKEIDGIFEKAVAIMDDAERKPHYDRWQMLAADNLPLIYTVVAQRLSAIDNRLGNLQPKPLASILHNIEELYIKAEDRK